MAKKFNTKSTKAEIIQAYEELEKEKAEVEEKLKQAQQQPKANVAKQPPPPPPVKQTVTPVPPSPPVAAIPAIPAIPAKPEPILEVSKTMNSSQPIQQKMEYTIDNLNKLQLGFGSAVSELSEKLTAEASKLQEIQEAVTNETKQLGELHNIKKITEDTLDNFIQQYQDSAKTFSEESRQSQETLTEEITLLRKTWEKEQEENQRSLKERNENYSKNRHRTIDTYRYDTELQRQLDFEQYEQTKKALYKALEETKQSQEKTWAEREKAIADREKTFNESKTKVEALEKELEAATNKAKNDGKNIASYQAKVKADLLAKEVEGQKNFYELRVQSLEETIEKQQDRIENLSNQLTAVLKQVQDLAVKAIEGASNVTSSQVFKEIAIEQAKGVQKGK